MIYSTTLCILLAVVAVFGQTHPDIFKTAKFTVAYTAPNKITITSNKFNDKQHLVSYHVVKSQADTAPTVNNINSPDITTDPWKWEHSDSSFTKGEKIFYWVRMQTNENPPQGYNSPTQSATL